ncbi:hypothetical protein D3C81_785070 [compost metagenome]
MRELPQQPAIQLLGDTRRQWFATGQVLLYAGGQRCTRVPVAAVPVEDIENNATVYRRATIRGTVPLALLALAMALPFTVSRVGKSERRPYCQRE